MRTNLDRKALLEKEIQKEEQYIKDRKIVLSLCCHNKYINDRTTFDNNLEIIC